jgi:hypothetical protein
MAQSGVAGTLAGASKHYFHGKQSPNNPVIQQVQEALAHKE